MSGRETARHAMLLGQSSLVILINFCFCNNRLEYGAVI